MWMLIHGFMGSPESWSPLIGELSSEAVLAPWVMGHGSGWRAYSGARSFEEEVERLAEVARTSDEPLSLCGYSLGARLAMGLLSSHSELFERACLVSGHPGLRESSERTRRVEADARYCNALRDEGVEAFVDQWEGLPLFSNQNNLPETTLQQQRRIRTAHEAEGLARSLEVLGLGNMPAWWSDLKSCDTPTLVVSGSDDQKFTELATMLAADMPRAERRTIRGVGHNVLLEAPTTLGSMLSEWR